MDARRDKHANVLSKRWHQRGARETAHESTQTLTAFNFVTALGRVQAPGENKVDDLGRGVADVEEPGEGVVTGRRDAPNLACIHRADESNAVWFLDGAQEAMRDLNCERKPGSSATTGHATFLCPVTPWPAVASAATSNARVLASS